MLPDFCLHLSMDEREPQEVLYLRLSDKLAENKKSLVAFCFLMVLACAGLGSLVIFMGGVVAMVLQLIGFLALGFMHTVIMRSNLSLLTNREKTQYSLVLAASIIILQSIFISLPVITTRF